MYKAIFKLNSHLYRLNDNSGQSQCDAKMQWGSGVCTAIDYGLTMDFDIERLAYRCIE